MSLDNLRKDLHRVVDDLSKHEQPARELGSEESELRSEINELTTKSHDLQRKRTEEERKAKTLMDRKHSIEEQIRREESRSGK